MLLDKQNLFSDAQTVTATAYSTNSIKMGDKDVSYIPIIIQVVQDFAGLTNLMVEIETSATSNFSSSTSLVSSSMAVAKLTAGARFPISYLPKGNLGYMRLKYTVTGTGTAGKITAGVVDSNRLSWHDQ